MSPPPRLARDPLLYGVILFTLALCCPFFRFIPWLGDEGVVLHGATRLLRGEDLYRDFFELLPPGSFLLTAAWMKVFGADFAAVRTLALVVIASIAALTYAAARLASGSRLLAAGLAMGWATFSQGGWTVVSPHWFATAASMAAGWALLGEAPFVAGLFAGVAAIFFQTRGAFLCAAIFIVLATLPGARVALRRALVGAAVVPAAALLFLIARGTLSDAWADVIRYPFLHYSGIQPVPFGRGATTWSGGWMAMFPLVFLGGGVRAALHPETRRDPRLRASLALAVVAAMSVFPRADMDHILFATPLACPLFARLAAGLVEQLGRIPRVVAGVLWIALCLPRVVEVARLGPLRTILTPRGPVTSDALSDELADLLAGLERLPKADPFFFYPYSPMLPYLTGRRHVAALDVMMPTYTTPEEFRATCVQVLSQAHWLVVDSMWIDSRFLQGVFPAMTNPDPPERHTFEVALAKGFARVVHASAFFEVRERTSASVDVCQGIAAP
jgi:hypothetical protein